MWNVWVFYGFEGGFWLDGFEGMWICYCRGWVWELGITGDGSKMLEAGMASLVWGRVLPWWIGYMQSLKWAVVRLSERREEKGENSPARRGKWQRCLSECGWASNWCWSVGWSWGELGPCEECMREVCEECVILEMRWR